MVNLLPAWVGELEGLHRQATASNGEPRTVKLEVTPEYAEWVAACMVHAPDMLALLRSQAETISRLKASMLDIESSRKEHRGFDMDSVQMRDLLTQCVIDREKDIWEKEQGK